MTEYATMVDFITKREQPKMNWRDAHAANPPVANAGSLWERNPRYVYGIGPYDIAPGQSIEWTEIFLCGQMSRDTTMIGGLAATRRFVSEGLKNLKENWRAARTLIANNYRFPAGHIPPPTPGDAPRVGNTNEVSVTPGDQIVGGKRVAGINLSWKAVHVGYVDPQSRKPDFASYKIYRSDNSVEGPWTLIDSVGKARADTLVSGGKVTYFLPTPPGVPYRFCVTSVDSGGNESARTGYSYYPLASGPDPSNDQQKIVVVPNPFRQVSGYADQSENKRLSFMNIPSRCTIRIYTVSLDLVRTLEHTGRGRSHGGARPTRTTCSPISRRM